MVSFSSDVRQDSREPMRVPTPAPVTQPIAAAAPVKKVAILGPTLRFKGELSAEEDFILQGTLEGSITNPQCVTVGMEGSVTGDINARVITIDGKVEGDLHGGESVVVHQTGRVTGNIYAPRVGIVEGAFFNGRIEMVQKSASASARPAAQAVAPPGVPLTEEETERMIGKK